MDGQLSVYMSNWTYRWTVIRLNSHRAIWVNAVRLNKELAGFVPELG
jgi:hypothetical protein